MALRRLDLPWCLSIPNIGPRRLPAPTHLTGLERFSCDVTDEDPNAPQLPRYGDYAELADMFGCGTSQR